MKIELGTVNIAKQQLQISLYDQYKHIDKTDNQNTVDTNNEKKDFIEKSSNEVSKNEYEKILDKLKPIDFSNHINKNYTNSLDKPTQQINLDSQNANSLSNLKSNIPEIDVLNIANSSISRDANLMKIKLAILGHEF